MQDKLALNLAWNETDGDDFKDLVHIVSIDRLLLTFALAIMNRKKTGNHWIQLLCHQCMRVESAGFLLIFSWRIWKLCNKSNALGLSYYTYEECTKQYKSIRTYQYIRPPYLWPCVTQTVKLTAMQLGRHAHLCHCFHLRYNLQLKLFRLSN